MISRHVYRNVLVAEISIIQPLGFLDPLHNLFRLFQGDGEINRMDTIVNNRPADMFSLPQILGDYPERALKPKCCPAELSLMYA